MDGKANDSPPLMMGISRTDFYNYIYQAVDEGFDVEPNTETLVRFIFDRYVNVTCLDEFERQTKELRENLLPHLEEDTDDFVQDLKKWVHARAIPAKPPSEENREKMSSSVLDEIMDTDSAASGILQVDATEVTVQASSGAGLETIIEEEGGNASEIVACTPQEEPILPATGCDQKQDEEKNKAARHRQMEEEEIEEGEIKKEDEESLTINLGLRNQSLPQQTSRNHRNGVSQRSYPPSGPPSFQNGRISFRREMNVVTYSSFSSSQKRTRNYYPGYNICVAGGDL
eukprot:jgi/Bigna1/90594/estExt_fgenesh1_pg.C_740018